MIAKLLREPLVHFLGLALLIFAFFGVTGIADAPDDPVIAIDATEISAMAVRWQQQYRRPPTADELDGLIDEAVRNEIYVREGLRLGLDQNDPVVRQRLIQKVRFLEDGELAEPGDAELRQWFDDHRARYATGGQFDMAQVYLGQRIGKQDWRTERAALDAGTSEPGDLAVPLSVPTELVDSDNDAVARQFGESFAEQLDDLPVGRWVGPVQSGFGWHLVKIARRDADRTADFESVRQQVANDWRAARRAELAAANLDRLKRRYDIRIERPE